MLKPVDDARMFEKMGQTLADTGRYEVHILGFPSDKARDYPDIHLHPSERFPRIGLQRLLMPFRIFRKIKELDPDIVIVTTHELMFTAVAFKMLRKVAIIYDIRENYFRNILFLPSFPLAVRPFLALWVRAWEKILSPFVTHTIVSEKGYLKELPFTGDKTVVIENKVKRAAIAPPVERTGRTGLRLLFSGTLAESTGVFTAIHLAETLHKSDPDVSLTITGYCAQRETLQRIKELTDNHDFIRLEGGDRLVPHDEIMSAIANADVGIIAYPPNPSTRNTVPTKMYEYLGAKLPIVLINHPPWMELCARYPAAMIFDPRFIKAETMLSHLRNTRFYTIPPGEEVFWESEGKKLVEMVGKC